MAPASNGGAGAAQLARPTSYLRLRKTVAGGVTGGAMDGGESLFATGHPAVWEYLTAGRDEEGVRVTSTLLIFAEAGRIKACLYDRHHELTLFVSGESMEALLDDLESTLVTGGGDWRPKRGGRNSRS